MNIFCLVGIILLSVVCRADQDSFNIDVKQPHAQMYHQQSARDGQFNYGYHINTDSNQFQHKVKGPDDVTYGCYGYVDPTNRKHLVYYVADRMGYRIIFPNRPTKIFVDRVTDSLNKLDGSLKSKQYDEKVVAWNDLYLPDSCYRLGDILSQSASAVHPQIVKPQSVASTTPVAGPVYVRPELPRPTQYNIPTVPPYTSSQTGYEQSEGRYTGATHQTSSHVTYSQGQQNINELDVQDNRFKDDDQDQQTVQPWAGSIPDINPAQIDLPQFDIRIGEKQDAVASIGSEQFNFPQYSLNISQLLTQIEAANAQYVTLNKLLTGIANNPAAYSNVHEGSCQGVLQLLRSQKRTPQLVYVPILIPYVEGQHNINLPLGANRYQQQAIPSQ
ncbi:uncharacterized protein LOC131691743 [Topomyia yanbarensis]|uniref:uncharacterized protein LOC131691743 n=1 Tax=Topomyia yanbarensis TaxID=2498891 RepID=UPI00273B65E8|nr:uncharacterized protein LOC131691743 [Topomyia yanbarensis]